MIINIYKNKMWVQPKTVTLNGNISKLAQFAINVSRTDNCVYLLRNTINGELGLFANVDHAFKYLENLINEYCWYANLREEIIHDFTELTQSQTLERVSALITQADRDSLTAVSS